MGIVYFFGKGENSDVFDRIGAWRSIEESELLLPAAFDEASCCCIVAKTESWINHWKISHGSGGTSGFGSGSSEKMAILGQSPISLFLGKIAQIHHFCLYNYM